MDTRNRATIDLTEKIYGRSRERVNDGGHNPTGIPEYFTTAIGVSPITNLDMAYQFTPHLQVHVGAQNLFNRYPNKNYPIIRQRQWAANETGFVDQYPIFSPFGVNDGYWYAKAPYSF